MTNLKFLDRRTLKKNDALRLV